MHQDNPRIRRKRLKTALNRIRTHMPASHHSAYFFKRYGLARTLQKPQDYHTINMRFENLYNKQSTVTFKQINALGIALSNASLSQRR